MAGFLALLSASCGDMEAWDAADGSPAIAPARELREVSAGDAGAAPKAGRACAGEHNCKPGPHCRLGGDDQYWEVAPETTLKDGTGQICGTLAGENPTVRINFGQRKDIGGQPHVYAWSTSLVGHDRAVSGWVPLNAVHGDDVRNMVKRDLPDPGHGDYVAIWKVTGGHPGRYSDYRLPGNEEGRGQADHYLRRDGCGAGVVNLLWSLPGSNPATCGMAADSFPVGSTFRRSRGVSEATVPFYKDHTHAKSLHFIYGHIGDRYGWIAREALEGETPELECNLRCCGLGKPAYQRFADDPDACIDLAQAVCNSRGHILRVHFNGETIHDRDRRCWAKCHNRGHYHAVPGVRTHCSERAGDFCRHRDRGGLQNAKWDVCRPG